MHLSNNSAISKILQGVFAVYRDRVPDVQKITDAMVSHGIVKGQSEIHERPHRVSNNGR